MKRLLYPVLALLALGCRDGSEDSANGGADHGAFDGLRIEAEDGTRVFALLVKTDRAAKGIVLMYHQAGSNMHEYDPIARTVAKLGWDCLKVDQRAGGEMWGEVNLSVSQFDEDQTYIDAYEDLVAALDWANEQEYDKVVAWGSSYSASLVLKLASENESVDAAMCFSPGEYEHLYPGGQKPEDGSLVAGWNASVNVPVFFAGTAGERDVIYAIKDSAPDTPGRNSDMVYTTARSVHGSSTLREDKNPEGNEWYWEAVQRFLKDIESDGRAFGG